MPFLNHLRRWSDEQPGESALENGADVLSYADLHGRATALLPETGDLSTLALPNGAEFVVRLAAGVSGERRCAVLDPAWPAPQAHAVRDRLQALHATAHVGSALRELGDGPPDSVFLYGFTSGTTSVPKAFRRTRGSWPLQDSIDLFGLSRHDRTLIPGAFSTGLSLYALAESLHAGAAVLTMPRFDVGAALASIRHRGVTRIVAVPSALRLIAARGLASGVGGGAVANIVSGGARLDADTRRLLTRWAPAATIHEYFGAAELSFVSASKQLPGTVHDDTTSTGVGRPFPGVGVAVRDPAGHDRAPGEPGTIVVRSSLVCEGYAWGDDGQGFRREGEWNTVGDQGMLDADGTLHYLGRAADMIVTGGHNVYPHEVEAALEAAAGVTAVVVTGQPDAARGTRVIAAVLGDPALRAASLRGAAGGLAEAKRPRGYYRLTELPLTPAGKISRRLLGQWIDEGDPRAQQLD